MTNCSWLRACVVLIVFGPLFLMEARAGTLYYVDNCGDDTACNGTMSACYNGGAGAPNCAKKTIQAGLCLATSDGDTVTVAEGTYTGSDNRDLVFPKSGGGACPSSTGTARAITLQCETPDHPELCVIDCEGGDETGLCDSGGSTAEHRGFRFYDDSATNGSVVDGFTIKNGCIWNDDPNIDKGGGILIFESAPTIRNCILEDNRAPAGGAIALVGTDPFDPGWLPVIEECTIQNSRTVQSGGMGGGIYVNGHIDPLVKNCLITDNCTTNTASACDCSASTLPTCVSGQGGGIYWGVGCDPQIEGSVTENGSIIQHNAAGEGGGVFVIDAKLDFCYFLLPHAA